MYDLLRKTAKWSVVLWIAALVWVFLDPNYPSGVDPSEVKVQIAAWIASALEITVVWGLMVAVLLIVARCLRPRPPVDQESDPPDQPPTQ
ncbi:MAG: hypothetical protein P8Q36_05190 [Alphaproteobacteria bacterium]|jgi:hypothetical protein|nr:hypothetical protein [Rhodospirillaceae bacterium]MBT7614277.1 hypothetical protein [Rhodospirillaceae bacterium]MBT7648393.1 hypothetical protein [Rhodospirillaceae bacterium]MDG2480252.1 hypothetical protein [Alphaproteobacteria bacterium]